MRIPNRKPIYPFGDNDALYFGTSYDVGVYWNGTYLVFDPVAAGAENILFGFAAGKSTIYGGSNAGDDLRLRANTSDGISFIELYGNGLIIINTANTIQFKDSGIEMCELSFAANVTTIHGGATSGDDLELEANSTDAGAAIILEGNGDVALNPKAGSYVKFGTHVGTGDVVSNGHILIEDAGGTSRKVMITA